MLTQEQVEERMYLDGRDRMLSMMKSTEEAGRAAQAPYASRIFRDFVEPLAALVKHVCSTDEPGAGRAHVRLLHDLDPMSVAFLAVRGVLNACLQGVAYHRRLGYVIGRTIQRELVLSQIEDEAPALYEILSRDLARRRSQDERHRVTVFKMQAAKNGIKFQDWPVGAADQVGLWLLTQLAELGMIEMLPEQRRKIGYKREQREVLLEPGVRELIDEIKSYVAETSPAVGPCVEEPIPWKSLVGGGWHTPRMRRQHRLLVKCHPSSRPLLHDRPMPTVLAAVNALQATRWAVNDEVLSVVEEIAAGGRALGEIEVQADPPKPERPAFFDAVTREEMTPAQEEILRSWKKEMSAWYETRKLRAGRYGRFYTTIRQARTFRAYPKLHFVYFLDSRGRAYPMTYGLNPQGSDIQRGLLRFADGKPLRTESAIRWFLIHGANKFGFDSAPLHEREQWVREHDEQILATARDPVNVLWWADAENPIQFLAWCLEYARWRADPQGMLSHLPVSMDGSCNGLQHFSAMLRDPQGGRATNLVPSPVRQDIYLLVAEAARKRLAAEPPGDSILERWRQVGFQRLLVKRPVMTTPYGITQNSARDYMISDFLAKGKQPEFAPDEYFKAATTACRYVWPAIGDVVQAARVAMSWLSLAGRRIAENVGWSKHPVISWGTPSGFIATQAYFDMECHRIRTHIAGMARIRVMTERDLPDARRHAQAFAPNFVHSMDAAHLHLVAARCAAEGISALAMIHDDYGTHAADAERMFRVIREEFVRMYERCSPLADLRAAHQDLPPPPPPGDLDLAQVLESDFFFS